MVDEVEDMGLTVPEDVEEVMETLIEEVVEPTPVVTKLSGSIKEQLTALVGEDGVSTLEEVAKSTYKDLVDYLIVLEVKNLGIDQSLMIN